MAIKELKSSPPMGDFDFDLSQTEERIDSVPLFALDDTADKSPLSEIQIHKHVKREDTTRGKFSNDFEINESERTVANLESMEDHKAAPANAKNHPDAFGQQSSRQEGDYRT